MYSPHFTYQTLKTYPHLPLGTESCPDCHDVPTITTSWFVTTQSGIHGYLVAMVTTELCLCVMSQPGSRWRPEFLRYSRASSARGVTPRIQLGSWFPCLRQSFVCERRYKPDYNYYGKKWRISGWIRAWRLCLSPPKTSHRHGVLWLEERDSKYCNEKQWLFIVRITPNTKHCSDKIQSFQC